METFLGYVWIVVSSHRMYYFYSGTLFNLVTYLLFNNKIQLLWS